MKIYTFNYATWLVVTLFALTAQHTTCSTESTPPISSDSLEESTLHQQAESEICTILSLYDIPEETQDYEKICALIPITEPSRWHVWLSTMGSNIYVGISSLLDKTTSLCQHTKRQCIAWLCAVKILNSANHKKSV